MDLSQFHATVLSRQKFVDALGSETIDSWQFDWLVLENSSISFDHPLKSSMMRQLHSKMHSLCPFHDSNATFQQLFSDFLKLRSRISFRHVDMLKAAAAQHFQQIFPSCKVFFRDKVGGVQLGAQLHVQLDAGQQLRYHIKTHAAGRLMSNSSAPKPVQARELVVYKCLEYLGLGCETTFLHRSLKDVFIATLDAGTGDGASFVLFEKLASELAFDHTSGETVWGSLYDIMNRGLQQFGSIEEAIQHDASSQNFLQQISTLDLVSRIFRLHDLLNNAENFGFRISEAETPCLKVLDFRLDQESNFRVDRDKFDGFLAGNGLYNYEACHATFKYALCDRPTSHRVKTALNALTSGSLSNAHRCIDDARRNVRSFLETSDFEVDDSQLQSILEKCDAYCDAVHLNFNFFVSQLTSWSSDASS
jgi:hypothetical protein